MNTNLQQQTKQKDSSKEGVWKVLIPVGFLLIVLLGFSFKLVFRKSSGRKLSENKSLDSLDYVKSIPSSSNETTMDNLDDLSDLTEEEREYIAGILQKTRLVHSNY